jgi:cell wall-active antibiotic response 4TMS protein YvqF
MNGADGSLIRAIRGPITLITVGVLFAFNNFTPYQFHQTWPVLLIVFGLLSLLGRGVDPGRPSYPQAAPPFHYPPPDVSGAPSYRQSPYPQAPSPSAGPAGPAKGGFGSSAGPNVPPRPEDQNQHPGGTQ